MGYNYGYSFTHASPLTFIFNKTIHMFSYHTLQLLQLLLCYASRKNKLVKKYTNLKATQTCSE